MMWLCLTRRRRRRYAPCLLAEPAIIHGLLNGSMVDMLLQYNTTREEESEANLQDCNLLTFARPSL